MIYIKVMSIEQVRKYRIQLESPYVNNQGMGIALFDLISTFAVAYFIEPYIPFKINRKVYYLSLIPLGIVVHILFKQNTFLNKQIFSREINMYKILLLINSGLIVYYLLFLI
jgi:hypothetical protein